VTEQTTPTPVDRRQFLITYIRQLEQAHDDWVVVAHAWRIVAHALGVVALAEFVGLVLIWWRS